MTDEALIEKMALRLWKTSASNSSCSRDLDREWAEMLQIDRVEYIKLANAALSVLRAEGRR